MLMMGDLHPWATCTHDDVVIMLTDDEDDDDDDILCVQSNMYSPSC